MVFKLPGLLGCVHALVVTSESNAIILCSYTFLKPADSIHYEHVNVVHPLSLPSQHVSVIHFAAEMLCQIPVFVARCDEYKRKC